MGSHITHSTLATGFASASETVRSQQGDCTEHAMLLAVSHPAGTATPADVGSH
eukprot:COSAG01_NODE_3076_length_6633_cov_13.203857_8_plen_53_part_00